MSPANASLVAEEGESRVGGRRLGPRPSELAEHHQQRSDERTVVTLHDDLELLELDHAGPLRFLGFDHGLDLRCDVLDRLGGGLRCSVPAQAVEPAYRACRAVFMEAVLALVPDPDQRRSEGRERDRQEHEQLLRQWAVDHLERMQKPDHDRCTE